MVNKDTTNAMVVFEVIPLKCLNSVSAGRHYQFFNLLKDKDSKLSIKHLLKASEKGFLASKSTKESFFKTLEYIEKNTSEAMVSDLMMDAYDQLKNLSDYNKKIRSQLVKIDYQDQALRKDKETKACRSVYYDIRWGYAVGDTIENFEKMMECAHDYRRKDSIVLQQFVNMINDLGYVPSEESVLFSEIDVLVSHTSHFDFKENIDSIYRHSVRLGTLSPRVYAWYKGYNEEYYLDKPKSYYYTHSELMLEDEYISEDDLKRINDLRQEIGLPSFPGSLWEYGAW